MQLNILIIAKNERRLEYSRWVWQVWHLYSATLNLNTQRSRSECCCSWQCGFALAFFAPCTMHYAPRLMPLCTAHRQSTSYWLTRRVARLLITWVSQLVFSPIRFDCFSGPEALRAFTQLAFAYCFIFLLQPSASASSFSLSFQPSALAPCFNLLPQLMLLLRNQHYFAWSLEWTHKDLMSLRSETASPHTLLASTISWSPSEHKTQIL